MHFCNVKILSSTNIPFLKHIKYKIYIKIFFTVTATCFGSYRPSSGSLYWAWPKLLTLHATQHTHHNLTHMLPHYCPNYNDAFLLIVSTKKVSLARLSIYSLMTVCTDRNM